LAVPQHSGKRLALHSSRVVVIEAGVDTTVKLIRLMKAVRHNLIEVGEGIFSSGSLGSHAQAYRSVLAGWNIETVKRCGLGSLPGRIHGGLRAVNDVLVECVLE